MPIGANAAINFWGTLDDLDSVAAAVTDGSFSVVGDLAAWTGSDDAAMAWAIFIGTFGTIVDANSVVEFHLRRMNIADTTKDEQVPSANYNGGLIGSFPLDATNTAEQIIPIKILLPSIKTSQIYNPYIRNRGGQTLSSGWSVQIIPNTLGPGP